MAVSLAAPDQTAVTYLFDARARRIGQQSHYPWHGVCDASDNLIRVTPGDDGRPRQVDTDWQRQLLFHRTPSGRLTEIWLQQTDKPETRRSLIRFEYDREQRLIAAHDVAGTRRYEYFEHQLLRHWNRTGAVCETSYDRQGRVTETIRMGGVQHRSYRYDDPQQTTHVTDGLGNSSAATFNANKQVTQTTDEAGNASIFGYDEAGRMVQMTDQSGATTQMLHGSDGRPLGKIDPRGQAVAVELDGQGNLKRQISPAGVEVEAFDRDERGRIVQVKRAGKGSCEFKRAANGDIDQVTTPHGKTVGLNWSSDRFVLKETDAEGILSVQTFDILGRLLKRVNAQGA